MTLLVGSSHWAGYFSLGSKVEGKGKSVAAHLALVVQVVPGVAPSSRGVSVVRQALSWCHEVKDAMVRSRSAPHVQRLRRACALSRINTAGGGQQKCRNSQKNCRLLWSKAFLFFVCVCFGFISGFKIRHKRFHIEAFKDERNS